MSNDNSITLINNQNQKEYKYNIISPSRGPNVIDIRSLYKDTGMFTYDPGYTSTASCESKNYIHRWK